MNPVIFSHFHPFPATAIHYQPLPAIYNNLQLFTASNSQFQLFTSINSPFQQTFSHFKSLTANLQTSQAIYSLVHLFHAFPALLRKFQQFKHFTVSIPKPLIYNTLYLGLPEGPSSPVLTILKELLRQFES